MKNCRICRRPIVLVPSAAERARKYGETPAFYTALFDTHASCAVRERSRQAVDLMRRITNG